MVVNESRETGAFGVENRFLFFELGGIIGLTSGSESCDSSHVEKSGSDHTTGNRECIGRRFPEVKRGQIKSIGDLYLIGFMEIWIRSKIPCFFQVSPFAD